MEDQQKLWCAFVSQIQDFDLAMLRSSYGKGFPKKKRLSPDGYIQMAMQLAYYRMHKTIPKTYEPSMGRYVLLIIMLCHIIINH